MRMNKKIIRERMLRVAKKKEMTQKFYKLSVFFLFSIFYFLFSTSLANAASIYLSPSSGSYEVGKTFSVNVYASSVDQAMNAASGIISFSQDKLEIISISKSGSIISLC